MCGKMRGDFSSFAKVFCSNHTLFLKSDKECLYKWHLRKKTKLHTLTRVGETWSILTETLVLARKKKKYK